MIRFLQTPGPVKKIVLGGMLLVICAAMVITLVPGGIGSQFGFGSPGRGVVAKVGGSDVTAAEVQKQARQLMRRQFPRGSEQSAMLLPFFAQQAATQLIDQKAILLEADRLGLRATDQDVADELQHGQLGTMLFPDGKFIGEAAYQDFVERNDMTVPQFEQLVKDEILQRKLEALVAGAATVTDTDLHEEFEKKNTKVKFNYAVIKKEDLAKDIHATDAELKAYYDQHKQAYANSIPEKRKLEYMVVDTSKLASQATVTPNDIASYYDQHRDEYRQPEQVKVSHILIKTPLPGPDGKVDQKALDAAKQKAEDLEKQLKNGANFGDLAKKNSEDTDSAKNGGSLGWIQRGRFPSPDVEKAAFSLPKGATSDVINAGYGFDILHIDDKQDARVKPVSEVKDQIEPAIRQQKAQREADALATGLLTAARTQGLEKAASSKGLQVITTDYLARTDSLPGIGPAPGVMDAVFSAPNKDDIQQTQVPQGQVIFKVVDIKPPATPTFEQVRDKIDTQFKNERAAAALSKKTQELADRAKAEHDLKKAAKEVGATYKSSDMVGPDGQVPDLGSMAGGASVAFTMKPGEISGPIQASGNSGAVLQLLDKQAPSEQDYAAKKDQLRDTLVQAKQNEAFGLFLGNLKDNLEKSGKIKINQEEMKALTHNQGSEEGE